MTGTPGTTARGGGPGGRGAAPPGGAGTRPPGRVRHPVRDAGRAGGPPVRPRGKVRYLDAVVDRSGLVMAKDIRGRVGRLTAEVDAMGARLQDVEDQVAELASKGARVPAPNWSAMDQVHPRGRAGRAVGVGGPGPGPVPGVAAR